MDILPSYEEANTGPHWIQLVLPFVPTIDWRRCCLVNRVFYQQFAPRLWLDPLVTARSFGLHPNDDLAWYRRFISRHLKSVRLITRALVRSLDFRRFALAASGLYSTEASERAISDSFKALPLLFPHLLCFLIDGHPELDPASLVQPTTSRGLDASQPMLQLLDLAHCRHELTPRVFSSRYFEDLVYLDLSSIPGSIKSAVNSSLNPKFLPGLRLLKVRGREMDDSTAGLLFQTFGRRLWSLDISHNKLTDASIGLLIESCFSSLSFRSDAHYETEGKLVNPRYLGSMRYGPFEVIEESGFSSSFDHAERHMPDAPPYSQRPDREGLQEWKVVRSSGLNIRKHDDTDVIRQELLDNAIEKTISLPGVMDHNLGASQGGVTHLHLNGNHFTSAGIEKILRASHGRLEHLECDSCRSEPPGLGTFGPLPKLLTVSGLFSASHLFRPVFSSNLRSLRIHHSVVTQIPSVAADELTARAAWLLAETSFHERIQLAYPQPLIPDMNPRIVSLVLTRIPARSIGPLISRLTSFLDLASEQQQAIERAAYSYNQRRSSTLRGLRHIRLEMEPEYSKNSPTIFGEGHTNFDDLLDPANGETRGDPLAFDQDTWGITARRSQSRSSGTEHHTPSSLSKGRIPQSAARSTKSPDEFTHNPNEEYITHRVDASESWNGNVFSVPVWVGSGVPGPHPAANEYMTNLRDLRLHANVGPAMPNQVAGGVPYGSYIFYAAWDSMVFPKHLNILEPSSSHAQMLDVADAIKRYRLGTKGTPKHWTGNLELVRNE
ncbi:hypothetical protein BJ170DRAFT_476231 [Xylariales sp. AK1849]|nr:hypothetical protein BJ170DRAFT_476231 [Xylariales sp. AK1849]